MEYIHVANNHGKRSSRNDVLKLIAMITMLIDHIGLLFFPQYRWMRTIGRIAFPIFAYQLALGYEKTHDRLAYGQRLLLFACISQIPYVFLNPKLDARLLHFNVIALFAYGLIVLFLHDWALHLWHDLINRLSWVRIVQWLLAHLLFLGCLFLPLALEVMFPAFMFSYSTYGLVMILLFHRFRHAKLPLYGGYIMMSVAFVFLSGGEYFVKESVEPLARLQEYFSSLTQRTNAIVQNVVSWRGGPARLEGYFFQTRSIITLPLIDLLEYMKPKFHMHKYIAYAFYPLHITLLILIKWGIS